MSLWIVHAWLLPKARVTFTRFLGFCQDWCDFGPHHPYVRGPRTGVHLTSYAIAGWGKDCLAGFVVHKAKGPHVSTCGEPLFAQGLIEFVHLYANNTFH